MKYSHNLLILIATLCFTGCNTHKLTVEDTTVTRSIELQKYIDDLLAEDADNKRIERQYLNEIAIAQKNDDQDAYKFYMLEFMSIPRLKLPEWMKNEPGYVLPLSDEDILNRQFKLIVRVKPGTGEQQD